MLLGWIVIKYSICYLKNPMVLLHERTRVQLSVHIMPYLTKDKVNLNYLWPCTSSVQVDHWLLGALWKNIDRRLATLLSPPPWAWGPPSTGVKQWQFWLKQWHSHATCQHNGSKWSLGQWKLLQSKLWRQFLYELRIPSMLWKGGDIWGEPAFHS